MNAYIFQADILCEPCATAIKAEIASGGMTASGCFLPANPNDEQSYDSDTYPKGPYADGGGESDCPQHCGRCSQFLENPLTRDGEAYVLQAINTERCNVPEWREFYSYLFEPNQILEEKGDGQ